jgi:hypothetical protein
MMYCSSYSLADHTKFSKEQLNRIQHKYKKYNEEHGAKINRYTTFPEMNLFLKFIKIQTFHRPLKNSIEEEEKKTIQ